MVHLNLAADCGVKPPKTKAVTGHAHSKERHSFEMNQYLPSHYDIYMRRGAQIKHLARARQHP
jgi:hypothetical protein